MSQVVVPRIFPLEYLVMNPNRMSGIQCVMMALDIETLSCFYYHSTLYMVVDAEILSCYYCPCIRLSVHGELLFRTAAHHCQVSLHMM